MVPDLGCGSSRRILSNLEKEHMFSRRSSGGACSTNTEAMPGVLCSSSSSSLRCPGGLQDKDSSSAANVDSQLHSHCSHVPWPWWHMGLLYIRLLWSRLFSKGEQTVLVCHEGPDKGKSPVHRPSTVAVKVASELDIWCT